MIDENDKLNKNKVNIIDEVNNDIIELEININKNSNNKYKSSYTNNEILQMKNNDVNVINNTKNSSTNLLNLEDNINKIHKNKIIYNDNIVINLLELENNINCIDKGNYIIDDESEETIIPNNNVEDSMSLLNSHLLTKNNFKSLMLLKTNIQIYGCSHSRCFSRKNIKIGKSKIYNNYMSSASISGVINDISSLNYKSIITNNILKYPFDYHIFKLGQIDIEYVYYFKTLKKKIRLSKGDFLNDIINKFFLFIKRFINRYATKIIICGSNIVNPSNWEETLKSILDINELPSYITYESKNKDIFLFNSLLKKKCLNNNIKYFDTVEAACLKNKKYESLNYKYIGNDYHYKGAENEESFNNKEIEYGFDTYYLFLNSLLSNLR